MFARTLIYFNTIGTLVLCVLCRSNCILTVWSNQNFLKALTCSNKPKVEAGHFFFDQFFFRQKKIMTGVNYSMAFFDGCAANIAARNAASKALESQLSQDVPDNVRKSRELVGSVSIDSGRVPIRCTRDKTFLSNDLLKPSPVQSLKSHFEGN